MLVFWGIVVHIIFLISIFDIYFKSPIIHGVREYVPEGNFPAARVVLISADGLRAESLFRSTNAEYLKYLIKYKANWGISHTRVPTESRPGHVAIIAGFYEDPSAVAKGWKENPVEFDSLFNRSRHTWSWGSPDILPMFAKGATGNHIDTFYYSNEEEDFSGKVSTSKLDTWVFDKVENFLNSSKHDINLTNLLKKDKVVFFLHLLGLDTAGHTHKPLSKEYEDNVKVVNDGVEKMVKLFEEFYNYDGKTVFVFTADHGMTDWGSHGAGEDHETQTPLIVWGAGTPEPNPSSSDIGIDNHAHSSLRKDVNQADICPLMAAFTGIPIPVNSVGILPQAYLEHDVKLKTIGIHSNARQLLSQYNRKKEIVENYAIKQIYQPFSKLTKSKVQQIINEFDALLKNNELEKVISLSSKTIELCLEGLDYYQNYYQHYLLYCISFSFVSWILWLLTVLIESYKHQQSFNRNPVKAKRTSSKIDLFIHFIFGTMFAITITLINVQNLPILYNVYCCLPIVLWWKGCLSWKLWLEFFFTNKGNTSKFASNIKFILIGCLYIIGSSVLVLIFFYRWILSICLLGVCLMQIYSSYNKNLPCSLLLLWTATCIILGVFSFLPVIGEDHNIHLVGGSGLLWFIGSLGYLVFFALKLLKNEQETKQQNLVLLAPVVMMLVTLQNKYLIEYMFMAKKGLPWPNQIVSWSLTALSFIVPMYSSHWMLSRLYCIMSCFAVFFILLSVSHEGFFLFVLACNLLCWLGMEHYGNNPKGMQLLFWSFKPKLMKHNIIDPTNRNLNYDDFRRSFFFLFYIILSFFGTGNIASINSFDPQWVRCFVSQFSPFLMGGLILCKTMVPFLYVACTFCAVNLVVKAPTGQLFLIVLVFSDLMGLHFLHMVTNKGSWLDIGSSISHYVIMETIILFMSLLYGLGQLLTGTSTFSLNSVFKSNTKVNRE